MNRQLLEMIKEQMKESIDSISFENIELQKKLFKHYWQLCEQLEEVVSFKTKHNLDNELSVLENWKKEEEQIIEPKEEVLVEKELIDTEEIETPTYIFERKLRGGYIPEINGFVPEGIVRKLGLEHGDSVSAKLLKEFDDNHKFYQYELVEKGVAEENPIRQQFNYCVVKKVAGRLAVDKSEETGKPIRSGEDFYTVLLDEQDIHEHHIQEGSLIDIAFYKTNPQKAKVLWVHKTEVIPEANDKNTGSKKKSMKEIEIEPLEQTLTGRTILLIGDESNRNHYEDPIYQRGGTLLTADAKDKLIRIEPLVKKADLVIFLLSVSGHVGGEHIKQMCRENDIPFETKWGLGYSGVIRIAEEIFTQVS
ncbi:MULTISPECIES: hypothetical protein [unclassified Psychrobacillus]|uniref:hypothetical protein n=1 Tax=unclassified Psychrobacillus TaxID=2636677 RepID=UPI0030F5DF4D